MKLNDLPFNVHLITPTEQMLKYLRPVKVMDIYDNSGVNFHENGLYSVSTFGRVGTVDRDVRFSFIDLKMPIFHPEVFENIKKLKALYADICSGVRYAVFDETIKDFVVATSVEGKTGFNFFMENWNKIVFKETSSDLRKLRIEFLTKYSKQATMDKYLVMPAGLRDIEVDEKGQTKEDDINGLYRRLLSAANTVSAVDSQHDISVYDVPRWTMQRVANEIYETIMNMLKGKNGWIQRKWGARRTMNGTRNVITAMDTSLSYIDSPDALEASDTQIGFVQVLRGALPFTLNGLKSGILGNKFGSDDSSVWLVNRKTLKQELVDVSIETLDFYGTRTGMEKLINRFFIRESRNKPIIIEGYYLGLIYVDDTSYRVFNDIGELPSHLSPKNVFPLTLSDLLFTSTTKHFKSLVGTLTRYPVTGTGSIYPTKYKVRTTTKSYTKVMLDDNWEPNKEETVYNFPDRDPKSSWLDSLVPHSIRLAGLGADFDGDTSSSPILYSAEAVNEIENYFTKRNAFVATHGGLVASANTDTVNLVIRNLTGKPNREARL